MKTLRLLAIAIGVCLLAPATSTAQDEPGIIHITRVKVKPDMMESYKKLVKDEVMPAYKKTEIEWIDTWEVWPYGDGAEIVFASELKSLAMFDEAHPLMKAIGGEAAAALLGKLRKHTVSFSVSAYSPMPNLSVMSDEEASVAVLWEGNATPGNFDQALHWLKTDFKPAIEKSSAVNYILHTSMFGASSDLMAVVMYKSFADLGKGHPIYQANKPEAAARIMARADPLFENDRVITLRRLPELSFDKTK